MIKKKSKERSRKVSLSSSLSSSSSSATTSPSSKARWSKKKAVSPPPPKKSHPGTSGGTQAISLHRGSSSRLQAALSTQVSKETQVSQTSIRESAHRTNSGTGQENEPQHAGVSALPACPHSTHFWKELGLSRGELRGWAQERMDEIKKERKAEREAQERVEEAERKKGKERLAWQRKRRSRETEREAGRLAQEKREAMEREEKGQADHPMN
ncbi:octapeptide-repeat protein T2-like [Macrobrachium rosenbergii]|uniref:octapeptide-repeat protein T2-like n=1 Tax=Macrobrachium rosenbergii TaxID=79674 RepID=UPI0034D71F15